MDYIEQKTEFSPPVATPTQVSANRLFRSDKHARLGGVCAGIALKKGWSISLTRLVTLLLATVTGVLLVVYLAMWILVPRAETIGVIEPSSAPNDPLKRSTSDRRLAGVCGGIARALKVDPTLVRVLFVVAVLCGGVGIVPYLFAWIAIPSE